MHQPRPSFLKIWFLAARPKTLFAGMCPVVIGTLLAYLQGKLHVPTAAACLAVALLIQIGTNFANDYFDFKKGADTEERLGPTRATQAGWVTPSQMKAAFIGVFALAVAIGLWVVFMRAGWPLLVLGILSVCCGILYTGGPFPLAYLGLGEVFVLIFFGPVTVMGTYFAQALQWSKNSFLLGISAGLFSVAIIAVNNLRDVDQDKLANKNTLAVRYGKRFMRFLYILSIDIACLIPGLIYGDTKPWAWMTTLTLILALPIMRDIFFKSGKDLNPVLAETGKLLAVFTLLLVLSLAVMR
jgi:1,4-dihydroxy-2-naphthoate octaprenyltransferase